MLLNLFLAILLDSFTTPENDDAATKKEDENLDNEEKFEKDCLELDQKHGDILVEYYQEVKADYDNKKKDGGM
jgi:hypothetical protein